MRHVKKSCGRADARGNTTSKRIEPLPQTLECPHDGFQRTGDGDLEFFMKSLSCFQPKTECEWQLDRAGSHKSRPGNPSPPRWKRNELRCRPAGIRLRHSPSLHPSSRYLRCRRRKGRRGYLRKDFGGSFTALFGLVPAKPVPPLPTRSCFLAGTPRHIAGIDLGPSVVRPRIGKENARRVHVQ